MKLTAQEVRTLDEFRRDWNAFCDADPVAPDFAERMEAAGFIELVPVDDEALDDPFAYERGIEPGGLMWDLTPAGRSALSPKADGGT